GLIVLVIAAMKQKPASVINQVPVQAQVTGTSPQSSGVVQPAVAPPTATQPMPLPPIFQQPAYPVVTIDDVSEPIIVQNPPGHLLSGGEGATNTIYPIPAQGIDTGNIGDHTTGGLMTAPLAALPSSLTPSPGG